MNTWPRHPVIYEIHTWVWLGELSRKYQRSVTLGTVPIEEWDRLADFGFDAIWFMGVWERSPMSIVVSMQNSGNLMDFRRALPDFVAADNVGSPYSVRRYVVDAHLGGPAGLAIARGMLRTRGMRLILDFVPNHIAADHPWVSEHPEFLIQGDADDASNDPIGFLAVGDTVFACGRDPFFPAWQDVLQLNAFHPGLRQAAIETIGEIAAQCDGIRCDMAMLLMNPVFERTWGARAGARPASDFWPTVIPAIRESQREFLFIAEAYWDLEWELQQQGFDFCYDKKLYDRMEHGDAENVRQHLCADAWYQKKMLRFTENHDELRTAVGFPNEKSRAAAVAMLTLSGARLLHEGQFEGRQVRLPVFLARAPAEEVDEDLAAFYDRLLGVLKRDVFRNGSWRLCEPVGWPDNLSYLNLLTWSWLDHESRWLIVINYSPTASQARIPLLWDELAGKHCRLRDELAGESFERSGDDMRNVGLYVDLQPWQFHFFQVSV